MPRDAYSQQARLITRSQQQVAANSNKLKQLGSADDNLDDHLLQERRSSSGGHSDSSMKKRVNPLPPSAEALEIEECPTCLEGMDSCIDLASIHFFHMLTNIKNAVIFKDWITYPSLELQNTHQKIPRLQWSVHTDTTSVVSTNGWREATTLVQLVTR